MNDTYERPKHGWTCFHCGETFTTLGGARNHFGFEPSADPACRIKLGAERGLVTHIRKLEDEVARLTFELHNDGADACKSYRAALARYQSQLQSAEELGYERGLLDGRKTQ